MPKMKAYNIRDGIFEALLHRFTIDPTMVAFGEENRDWGGAFAVYRGLTELLPYHRLFNAPISEAGIVGAAVGYGMEGGRVVAELMYADFMGRAGDELFNQLSKWQAMSAGMLTMPVVVRISVGAKYGAQHSQDFTALVAHIPGLKVVYPVTPYDAKGMMNSALVGTDPVIFFESQKLYDMGEMFEPEGVPEGYYEIDLSEPSVKRVRDRPHHRDPRTGPVHGGQSGRRAGGALRRFGRGRRPALGQPVELRAAGALGPQDREGASRLRGGRARQRHANGGVQPHPGMFRRTGRPSRGRGLQELDHAGARAGGDVLPPALLAARLGPRRDIAAARLPAHHQPDGRRAHAPSAPGDLARAGPGKRPGAGGPELY